MDDGVEALLEVDALGEAVGGDEDALGMLARGRRPAPRARRRRGRPVTASTVTSSGRAVRSAVGDVLGGGDEAAEDDRRVAVGEELLDDRDALGELRVVLARRARRASRARSRSRRAVVLDREHRLRRRVGTGGDVGALERSRRPGRGRCAGRSRRPRRRVGASARSGSARAASPRPRPGSSRSSAQERERRPPADPLALVARRSRVRTVSRA